MRGKMSKVASRISMAVLTSTLFTPKGTGTCNGEWITVTVAPKSRADKAKAMPILPDDRFVRKRTGSNAS